nr:unnamed protein product [Spirometra erinaceieuropaei]
MQYGDPADLKSIFETVNVYQPLVLDPVVHYKVEVEDTHSWLNLTEIRPIRVIRLPRRSLKMRFICHCLVCCLTPLIILLLLCLVLIRASVLTHPNTIEMRANKLAVHTVQDGILNASHGPLSELPKALSPQEYTPPPPAPQLDDSITDVSVSLQRTPTPRKFPSVPPSPSSTHFVDEIPLEKPHEELESLCSSYATATVENDSTRVFVKKLKPLEEIEVAINEIINSFISTLKHDEGWLGWLLKRIRKEQKLRAGKRCHTDMCLYRIPCYLSQKFRSESAYLKSGFNKTPPFYARIRKKRSVETIERVRETEPVKDGPLSASASPAILPILTEFLPQTSSAEPLESTVTEAAPAELHASANKAMGDLNKSKTIEGVTSVAPPVEVWDSSLVRENNSGDDDLDETMDSVSAADLDPTYRENSFGSPLVNCTGVYAEYCYNSISCMFVKVLEAAVCYCKPGYTGVRCDLYNLPQTLDTLSQFQDGTVDIDRLNPGDSAKLYSVLEATARYTYNAIVEEERSLFRKPTYFEHRN